MFDQKLQNWVRQLSSLLHLEHFEHRRKNVHAASVLSNRSESAAAALTVSSNVVPNEKKRKSVVTDDHRIYYCVGRTGTFTCKICFVLCSQRVCSRVTVSAHSLVANPAEKPLQNVSSAKRTTNKQTKNHIILLLLLLVLLLLRQLQQWYFLQTKKKPRNRPNYARGRRKIREIPITIASTIMRSTSHRPPFFFTFFVDRSGVISTRRWITILRHRS
jgi:hypothetical protein